MSEERLPPVGGDDPVDDEFELEDDPQDESTEPDQGDDPAGGPDAGADPDTADPAPQPRQQRPGRRERAREELRTLREDNRRLRDEFAAFRQQQQQRGPDPAEQARQAERERQYLDTLTPEARFDYLSQRQEQRFSAALAAQRLETADQIDRATFAASAQDNPLRSRYLDEVERLCQSERAAGRPTNREAIFRYVLGEHAERQYSERVRQTRQTAQRNVARQTTRPAGGRSDSASPAGGRQRANDDSIEATRARVRGQPLWES